MKGFLFAKADAIIDYGSKVILATSVAYHTPAAVKAATGAPQEAAQQVAEQVAIQTASTGLTASELTVLMGLISGLMIIVKNLTEWLFLLYDRLIKPRTEKRTKKHKKK